jgi:hypothetical protein
MEKPTMRILTTVLLAMVAACGAPAAGPGDELASDAGGPSDDAGVGEEGAGEVNMSVTPHACEDLSVPKCGCSNYPSVAKEECEAHGGRLHEGTHCQAPEVLDGKALGYCDLAGSPSHIYYTAACPNATADVLAQACASIGGAWQACPGGRDCG